MLSGVTSKGTEIEVFDSYYGVVDLNDCFSNVSELVHKFVSVLFAGKYL